MAPVGSGWLMSEVTLTVLMNIPFQSGALSDDVGVQVEATVETLTFCTFGPHISYTFSQKTHKTALLRPLRSKFTFHNFALTALHQLNINQNNLLSVFGA